MQNKARFAITHASSQLLQILRILSQKAEADAVYHARPLIFAFGLCAGAAAYFRLVAEPSGFLTVCGWLAALIWLQISLRKSGSLGVLLAIIGFSLASGFAVAKLRTEMVSTGVLLEETRPVMVEGWVIAIEPASKGVRVRLLTHAVEGFKTEERPREIRLTHRANLQVTSARFVRCLSVLRPPPGPSVPGDYDFRKQAWFEGLHAVGYVQGRCRGGTLGASKDPAIALQSNIASARRSLAEYTHSAAGPRSGGFAAALTSGDRSFMSPEDREALRAAGLAHLLAISGLHIGIVCGLVYLIIFKGLARWSWLARRMPLQKPAAIVALSAGAVYLIISGASVSTQRAFIMAALVFTAILINRNAISLRTFAIAMIVIVILSPVSVMSPGFQMSFAATGVLIAVYEEWRQRRLQTPTGFGSGPAFALKSLIVTSIAAGLATAPFAFYHFDRIAPFGLVANLLAMPIISFVTAPAAALSILLTPFGFAEYGLRVFGWSLEWVLAIAHWSAGSDGPHGPQWKQMPDMSLLFFAGTIGAFILLGGRMRVYASGLCVAAAFALWVVSTPAHIIWSPSGEVFVRSGNTYERIVFLEGKGLSPLRFKNLAVTGYCKNRRCLIETDGGKALLVGDGEEVSCSSDNFDGLVLSAGPPRKGCVNQITFLDITEKGGAAIWINGSTPIVKFAKTCGKRPWMPHCGT